ncbi:MAG: hypothetical protein KVP17_004496 [Porospora cf. gigantea B]|uniref:uncharacterized protein n=1 Tax=Porospora cf. gigantea B TaxID=2853592 RepID=UPI0035719C5C|nr:MAG: hypothetical protein KVP17_004496 [Porospora cf. gigantea B]
MHTKNASQRFVSSVAAILLNIVIIGGCFCFICWPAVLKTTVLLGKSSCLKFHLGLNTVWTEIACDPSEQLEVLNDCRSVRKLDRAPLWLFADVMNDRLARLGLSRTATSALFWSSWLSKALLVGGLMYLGSLVLVFRYAFHERPLFYRNTAVVVESLAAVLITHASVSYMAHSDAWSASLAHLGTGSVFFVMLIVGCVMMPVVNVLLLPRKLPRDGERAVLHAGQLAYNMAKTYDEYDLMLKSFS